MTRCQCRQTVRMAITWGTPCTRQRETSRVTGSGSCSAQGFPPRGTHGNRACGCRWCAYTYIPHTRSNVRAMASRPLNLCLRQTLRFRLVSAAPRVSFLRKATKVTNFLNPSVTEFAPHCYRNTYPCGSSSSLLDVKVAHTKARGVSDHLALAATRTGATCLNVLLGDAFARHRSQKRWLRRVSH